MTPSGSGLDGRCFVVTGAGSGIGKASCLRLMSKGARVVAVDRNLVSLGTLEKASPSDRLHTLQGDVITPETMGQAVDAAFRSFGRFDGAFNNAGIGPAELGAKGKKTDEFTLEEWNTILSVNLTGTWLSMKAQLPRLSLGGTIVNNASIAGLNGIAGSAAYVASKHGVIGLTKTAALEGARKGIRVNAVCPGYIATNMTSHTDRLAGSIPVGRLGDAVEVAALVEWLLSDASHYVTGSALTVDGGLTAGISPDLP